MSPGLIVLLIMWCNSRDVFISYLKAKKESTDTSAFKMAIKDFLLINFKNTSAKLSTINQNVVD